MNKSVTTEALPAKEIVKIVRKRREYTRVLLEMSREQHKLILGDAYMELLELLAQKQQIVTAAEKLASQYSELWKNWKTVCDRLPVEQQSECEQLLDATETDFQELLNCEQQGTEELKSRRGNLQTQLSTVAHGSIAHHAYHEDFAPTHHIDIGK